MSSGDPVVQIISVTPPASSPAIPGRRAGGSSPAESIPIWRFDDTTAWYLDFYCALVGYDGGGLTFPIRWFGESATSGTVQWELALQRVHDDANDVDVSHTYAFNTTSVTTANVSGEADYASITFTDGADMDSLADDESFIARLRRNPAGTDTMVGDAQLWTFHGIET